MSFGGLGLAFLAGLLSVLSPCVLPLLPIVLGAAASEHRFGPALLAVGAALSFVAIGLFVATIGFGIGLDGDAFRTGAAAIMIFFGILLATPAFQLRAAAAAGPLSDRINRLATGIPTSGLRGQFLLGLLLGAVWSPCVGPTLGAASILAARRENLHEVALTMATFGFGAALPLLAFGLASRQAVARLRDRLLATGKHAKTALGLVLITLGALIIFHLDKQAEAALVAASPEWLTALTTRY